MSLIIPISLIVIVVFIIALAISAKEINSEGGEDVIKKVYVYLVLFATLMMVIGGSVSAFMAVADIVSPTPHYQSFEDYRRIELERKSEIEDAERQTPSEEELLARYEKMVLADKKRQVDRAKNSLIKSFGWIVIPLPIFIYFQRNLVKA